MNIAIIGTGVMGTGVGQTLLAKGHSVRCYNRTPENAAPLVQAGAVFCATPQEAAQGATHVIILVWNEAALHAVLQDPDGLLAHAAPGQVFIDMSTQLPQTAKDSAAAFAGRGTPGAQRHRRHSAPYGRLLWVAAHKRRPGYKSSLTSLG